MNERLFLPERLFGCIGIEMNLYFANIFTALNPANYFFRFSCDLGRCDEKRWHCIPDGNAVGIHEARLQHVLQTSGKNRKKEFLFTFVLFPLL